MRAIILASVYFVAQALSEEEVRFLEYMSEYGKQYNTLIEYFERLDMFKAKDAVIKEHNARQSSYVLGHNKFSDRTDEEMQAMMQDTGDYARGGEPAAGTMAFPTTLINWVDNGCVNPIQDQGSCGSCWAFSTVASMEGAYCVKTSQLLKFSE
jgi:xylem cysteine proteinase/KDEL-tailed cysteine endopeptidase